MTRIYIIIALVYGAYYYVSRHYKFEDTLTWAQTHQGSRYADDVNYYVGLAYYQHANYPQAQKAFMQLLNNHATSEHLAMGLVRLEDAAEYNHDWDVARLAVDKYLDEFPSHKHKEIMQNRAEQLKMKGR